MVTPEWAKRKWPSGEGPGTAPQLGGPPDGLPTAGRPLNRGPVARRLNIDQARPGCRARLRAAQLRTALPSGLSGARLQRRCVSDPERCTWYGCICVRQGAAHQATAWLLQSSVSGRVGRMPSGLAPPSN